jgi:dTDP-4-dehydrorhamnose 3,5-epimerase-like enzyme
MSLSKVKLIELPKITDPRGNLSFFESGTHIPFTIKRAYWIYDVPGGIERGSHAFKTSCEFLVSLSGSFDVVLSDGHNEKVYHLNRSYFGIYIPNMIWRTLNNFSTNAVALVVASNWYDEDDYIRGFDNYKAQIDGF